jgi:7-keto-8-aminopelargonate synthetase-like enzyme
MLTETAIVPVCAAATRRLLHDDRCAQEKDLFVLPVVSPAVGQGLARLRATVTAAHEPATISSRPWK